MANQYGSRKADLVALLCEARLALGRAGQHRARGRLAAESAALRMAGALLILYRRAYFAAPASSRRRWKCGR